jgi:hypothetical protein
MNKYIKIFLYMFFISTIIFGLDELSFKNIVFSKTLFYCCGNGQCNDMKCTGDASEKLDDPPHTPEDCRNYNFTCKDCIDYEISNCICNQNQLNIRCINEDNSYYYGTTVPCPTVK